MTPITKEMLASYLDDALTDAETAAIERALRESESLRVQLKTVLEEADRGEHSVGAIWRRHHLTCPSREEFGNFLLGVLDDDRAQYIDFHLKVIGCSYCHANFADLESQQKESEKSRRQRRQKFYESSVGLLRGEGKK